MSAGKKRKPFFARYAKSSAALISLGLHAVLILVALSYVAVTVIKKEESRFTYTHVERPEIKPKQVTLPKKAIKQKLRPKLRKNLVAKNVRREVPDLVMPEVVGMIGGMGSMGGEGVGSFGFEMPEIDFFGAKASGEKVVFVVHFGPATIGGEGGTPFTRMTGYTIRKRLEDMVEKLPAYSLFNVVAYWGGDTVAMSPEILLANDANKQMVRDWMKSVNPLEGDYHHCFSWGDLKGDIKDARKEWPTRVEDLPFYSMQWAYPYEVPRQTAQEYLPKGIGFKHWGRAVAWAVLEQKADTIFVLTTNYIDGWGSGLADDKKNENRGKSGGQPDEMLKAYKEMFSDVYGPDKDTWPTISVVVLAGAGKESDKAHEVLHDHFGPIWRGTDGDGSIIEDISDYMTEKERDLFDDYRREYGTGKRR